MPTEAPESPPWGRQVPKAPVSPPLLLCLLPQSPWRTDLPTGAPSGKGPPPLVLTGRRHRLGKEHPLFPVSPL